MDIQIISCSLKDYQLIQQCVKLYCKIWEEPPWEEKWDGKKVLKDIENELREPNAKMLLALKDGQVVGFTWGYFVDRSKLRKISGNWNLDFIFDKNEKIYYIDELGVDSLYRKRGIGKMLTDALLLAIPPETNKLILRTDKEADSARQLYEKLHFIELEVLDEEHHSRSYWLRDYP